MAVKAVIDVGTNSVKLIVAELRDGRPFCITDDVVITKLGEELAESGAISEAASQRTIDVMVKMCERARSLGADEIRMVGTECVRRASNAEHFRREAQRACGALLDVIDGDEEARLSFAAAARAVDLMPAQDGEVLFCDIGGGSTEIAVGRSGVISSCKSVKIGALVLHREFFASRMDGTADADDVSAAVQRTLEVLAEAPEHDNTASVRSASSGGTVTTMAAVSLGTNDHTDPRINGFRLTAGEIDRQIKIYTSMPPQRRSELPGISPARADIILAGACVIRAVLERYGASDTVVTARGLRHEAVAEMLLRA